MRQAGLVSVNSKSQQLTYSGNYYAFPHYSKLIQRGARIFASSGDLPGIDHVAARNTDGSNVLVVTNRGVEQQVQCTLGTRALKLVLAADSITTFFW
jgi:glucosylceramidase